MAHVAKFTRGTCGLLTRHYDRYKDKEHPEEVTYKNQDIDAERTHLNYNLAPQHEQIPFLKKRLEEVHCLNRENVNVMCDWVVTAPKELPAEHQREFFETVYKHLAEKYGEKNVISAYVHMDENQPHLHFAFVPVVYDKKKKREKVSAKEVLGRADLKKFHPELQAVIDSWIKEKDYDFECNVLNGVTANGNRTIDELKAEKLENTLKTLQKDVEARKTILGVLNYPEIEKIEIRARESKMGKLQGKDQVIIDRADFNSLVHSANLYAAMNKKIEKLLDDAKKKIQAADKYHDEKIKETKAEVKQIKWSSLEEARAQIKKDQALENYQTMEKLFPDVFKEMSKQILKAKNKNLNHNHDLER